MKRNAKNLIEQYNKKYLNNANNSTVGAFYTSDYVQIKDLSKGDLYEAIENALKVGFIVGYNRAKREN